MRDGARAQHVGREGPSPLTAAADPGQLLRQSAGWEGAPLQRLQRGLHIMVRGVNGLTLPECSSFRAKVISWQHLGMPL